MANRATLMGPVPANIPTIPVEVIVPLPVDHGLTFDFTSKASPLSIRSGDGGGTDLPTDCEVNRYRKDGTPATVKLTATATQAQATAGLLIDDTPSPANDMAFALPTGIASRLLNGQVRVTVDAVDGQYAAVLTAKWGSKAIKKTKNRLQADFSAVLVPQDASCVLPNLGRLEGTITLFSGIEAADVDMLWVTGDVETPLGVNHFNSATISVGVGYGVRFKNQGPWCIDGRDTAQMVRVDPGGSSYPLIGGGLKLIRLSIFQDVAGDFPTWSDEWVLGHGQFYTQNESTDDADWCALNPATPITFKEAPMPVLAGSLLTSAATERAGFMAEVAAATAHDISGNDDEDFHSGWRHRIFPKYGGWGGGDFIQHFPGWEHWCSAAIDVPEYMLHVLEALLDRQRGFYAWQALPLDPMRYEFDTGTKLDMSMSPSGMGSSARNANWFGSKDHFGFQQGAENALAGTSEEFERIERSWGHVDNQHWSRMLYPLVGLVEYTGSPIAKRIMLYALQSMMCDSRRLDDQSKGTGKGIRGGRGEAWAASNGALVLAYIDRTDRAFFYDNVKAWVSQFTDMLRDAQLPNGGFCAWDHNKEFTTARDQLYEAAYEAKAQDLGHDTSGLTEEQILALLTPEQIEEAEANTVVPVVSQSYQESICAVEFWAASRQLEDLDERTADFVLLKHASAVCLTYRDQGQPEPWYRVAVHPLNAGPEQTYQGSLQVQAVYDSATHDTTNQYSGHHYKAELWVARRVAQGYSIEELADLVIEFFDPDYGTTANASKSLLENGEPLLALLQASA